MKSLHVFSDLMQGSKYPTSNLVMPYLTSVFKSLACPTYELGTRIFRYDESDGPFLFARIRLLEDLKKRLDIDLSLASRKVFYVCTLLNPTTKMWDNYPSTLYDRKWGLEVLESEWFDNWKPRLIADEDEPPIEIAAPPVVVEMSDFATMVGAACVGNNASLKIKRVVANELTAYLAETLPSECFAKDFNEKNLLSYWYDRRLIWPNLSRMVRQFLGIPATTGGLERLFSKAGKQHDSQKKSTLEESLNDSLRAAINTALPSVLVDTIRGTRKPPILV